MEHGALADGQLACLAHLIGREAARFGFLCEVARRLAACGRAHRYGRCDFGDDHLRVFFRGVVLWFASRVKQLASCVTARVCVAVRASCVKHFARVARRFCRASRVKHFAR